MIKSYTLMCRYRIQHMCVSLSTSESTFYHFEDSHICMWTEHVSRPKIGWSGACGGCGSCWQSNSMPSDGQWK